MSTRAAYARVVDRDELPSEAAQLRRPPSAAPGHDARSDGDPVAALAACVGNRNLTRVIARLRDGEGILGGGVVHPDVESAIAAASGRGQPLDPGVAHSTGAALGDSFADVRVHHDDHAAALSRAVSARAFTVGRDIFFGAGEYSPSTPGGRQLLTHELAHVVQQRGAAQTGPLTVSEPGDALEREAEAAAGGLG